MFTLRHISLRSEKREFEPAVNLSVYGRQISGLYQSFRQYVVAICIAERTTMSMIYIPRSGPESRIYEFVRMYGFPVTARISNSRILDGNLKLLVASKFEVRGLTFELSLSNLQWVRIWCLPRERYP